jgi:uncharacterized membrane protein
MSEMLDTRERQILRKAIARLRASILAIVCGLLAGSALAVATIWLVLRGGENVGQHLILLRNYLPFYSVTWPGAILGFFYGLLLGGLAGWTTAWIYNRIVDWRHPGVD